MIVLAGLLTISVVFNLIAFFSWPDNSDEIRRLESDRDFWKSRLEVSEQQIPKPICGCNHGYGHHKDGGRCMAYQYDDGGFIAWAVRADRCTCRHYTGPEPLPNYYHPKELS